MRFKITKIVVSLIAIYLSTPTFSGQFVTTGYSPYADISINAHWDSQYQDMEPMDLLSISQATGIKQYRLAFITDAGVCHPAWAGQASYSVKDGWGSHLTDNMRDHSIGYSISFGGASGSDISKYCNETQLIASFEQVLKTYQPQGLDFDIENGSADVNKLMLALKQVQQSHPTLKMSFTLPVLPEGLTASGKEILQKAKENGIRFSANIMAMDYGPAYVNDMGQYAIQAATNLHSTLKELYPEKSESDLWQMVEVTSMIGVNDVNVEQFTLENVDTLRHFAQQNQLGLLSMWSIARDQPCADKWASAICSGNNLQAKPYEFSQRFIQ